MPPVRLDLLVDRGPVSRGTWVRVAESFVVPDRLGDLTGEVGIRGRERGAHAATSGRVMTFAP